MLSAGLRPNNSATMTPNPAVNASTRPSSEAVSIRGTVPGGALFEAVDHVQKICGRC